MRLASSLKVTSSKEVRRGGFPPTLRPNADYFQYSSGANHPVVSLGIRLQTTEKPSSFLFHNWRILLTRMTLVSPTHWLWRCNGGNCLTDTAHTCRVSFGDVPLLLSDGSCTYSCQFLACLNQFSTCWLSFPLVAFESKHIVPSACWISAAICVSAPRIQRHHCPFEVEYSSGTAVISFDLPSTFCWANTNWCSRRRWHYAALSFPLGQAEPLRFCRQYESVRSLSARCCSPNLRKTVLKLFSVQCCKHPCRCKCDGIYRVKLSNHCCDQALP